MSQTFCALWTGRSKKAVQAWIDGHRLFTSGTLFAMVENVSSFSSPLVEFLLLLQMYFFMSFSQSGKYALHTLSIEEKKKRELRKKLLLTDIFKLMYKIMFGELQPIENTNLYCSIRLARAFWTLLYVWFKYWVQGRTLTPVSSPWPTVALRQLLSVQPAAAVPLRKAKPICYRSKV